MNIDRRISDAINSLVAAGLLDEKEASRNTETFELLRLAEERYQFFRRVDIITDETKSPQFRKVDTPPENRDKIGIEKDIIKMTIRGRGGDAE